jgi:hypothetical protein
VKKSLKKLNLSRETLRALESLDLVEGGNVKTQTPTCQTNCDCTFSCPDLCHLTTA